MKIKLALRNRVIISILFIIIFELVSLVIIALIGLEANMYSHTNNVAIQQSGKIYKIECHIMEFIFLTWTSNTGSGGTLRQVNKEIAQYEEHLYNFIRGNRKKKIVKISDKRLEEVYYRWEEEWKTFKKEAERVLAGTGKTTQEKLGGWVLSVLSL